MKNGNYFERHEPQEQALKVEIKRNYFHLFIRQAAKSEEFHEILVFCLRRRKMQMRTKINFQVGNFVRIRFDA